jgi:acetyltransferase-like isoleucine patch superfamily enzyme
LRLHIGPGCHIGDDVQLYLTGGSLVMVEAVHLRPRALVNVAGDLWFEGRNTVSVGCTVHCVQSIRVHRCTAFAEYSTIADSGHFHTEPEVPIIDNTAPAPVEIGMNVFLAPRVQVNRGVTIGDFAVVGPNSVVIRDVPRAAFASGVPAEVVGKLELPWEIER